MTGGPLLSVITVTWNSARWLPACLAAVAQAIAGMEAEVLVVDNGSDDGSAQVARDAFPGAAIIANSGNLGYARANDQAIERSNGRYLLLLNPDTEINAGALRGMIAVLEAQPDVGLVGCRVVGPDGAEHECYGTAYPGIRDRSPALRPRRDHPELTDAAWLGGSCILARRRAIEQVGGLDRDYFMYYEDVDWGLRMRRSAWRVVYWNGGQVVHHLGGSSRRVPAAETARRYITSEMLFHAKHSGWVLRRLVWAARLMRALRGIAYYALPRALGRDTERKYDRYRAWLGVLLRRTGTVPEGGLSPAARDSPRGDSPCDPAGR